MKKLKLTFFALLTAATFSHAQNSELIRKYIDTYKDIAIEEMQRTGVPASIKLAQGIFETTAGTSPLVLRSSNHFGIKCKSNWTGESVRHDDDLKQECFRKYPSALDSYMDHSNFLRQNSRYAFLFELDPTDYRGWAYGLKKAGYATNSRYPVALIKIIEDYDLQNYSLIALGKMPRRDDAVIAASAVDTEAQEDTSPVVATKTEPAPEYPKGVFLINETKVIFVTKGTSYFGIAKQYDVDLSKLYEFNDLAKTEQAEYDQLVFLQRKRKTGASEFHLVKPGETLHSISQQQGIRVESLRELNWLQKGDMPAAGETLSLHKKSESIPKLAVKEKYTIVPKPAKASN